MCTVECFNGRPRPDGLISYFGFTQLHENPQHRQTAINQNDY